MVDILKELHEDFITYAKEVNENRAFPDARDGLKPSARACLWEMFIRGYTSNKPHVKSAKVDGGVIANWHPHGSEYSTFVRMSQPWINNIPEVDWHGANGSQLGGPEPAAARYTECRLSTASEDGFFTNIKKNTIDMIPNFSEDDEWPIVFPAIFPRLFVNGSQGIGYTIAQEWEPGNLGEFVTKVKQYLKKKKITCDDIYPDYPTGGIIINKSDIHLIYETGKGSVILRGKAEIEGNLIKITSLPYQVYVEPFISRIKELVNNETLTGIEDICNKSDDSGLLIEIECSKDPLFVLNLLYKYTDLQCTFSANQMALVDGKPVMLSLEEYVKVYIEHNINCLQREYQFELDKANSRLEIVEGLLKAINDIDVVITTIKQSKNSADAKEQLVKKLSFSEAQAQAIVDMKLGKLAHLEGVELNNEKADLLKKVATFTKILSSDKLQEKEFIKRLDDFTAKYSWTRRTEVVDVDIKEEKKAVKKSSTSMDQYMITLKDNNELKKISLKEYRPQKDSNIQTIKVGSKDKFILISNTGKMYKLQANKISLSTMKSSGTEVRDLLTLGDDEYIKTILSGNEAEPYLFLITSKGNVKKMETSEVFGISKKAGTPIIKLKEGERVFDIYLVTDDSMIMATNSKMKTYQIKVSDFTPKRRKTAGVRGFKLKTYTLMYTSLLN